LEFVVISSVEVFIKLTVSMSDVFERDFKSFGDRLNDWDDIFLSDFFIKLFEFVRILS
jgi:hypothetical protein